MNSCDTVTRSIYKTMDNPVFRSIIIYIDHIQVVNICIFYPKHETTYIAHGINKICDVIFVQSK